MLDKVSIITPLYNGERFLSATIESVLAQTYPHWEMLIVNDGSTDGGEQIAQAYAAQDKRIHVFSQRNAGSAAARNNGIRRATGRYIALLDADDVWDPDFLDKQLTLMHTKGVQLVYGAYRCIDENGKEIRKPFVPPVQVTHEQLLHSNVIGCLTGVYDTEPYGKVYLREEFRSLRDDHIYWLDILRKVGVGYGNQDVIASYRIQAQSVTYNKWKLIIPQYKVYREVEKRSVFMSCYYMLSWAWNGFWKYR